MFVSTKYISVVTEHIISMVEQCSDVDSTLFQIVCCLYSLNGYASMSEDLYFVFRFDQIYLFCHLKDQFTSLHCSDVDLTLLQYDSVSDDLYFVFRFDQIYLFCHLKDQFTSLHCSDVDLTLLQYDSVSDDLYFVFRFDKIYLR